jgi:hypothetical protein
MGLSTTGMEFASEMVMKASFHKMRMAEVPVTLHKDGRSRPPHLRSWRDGWRHLRFMLLHCPLWLFMIPALVLLAGGAGFGVRLAAGPLNVGAVAFDTNTLLVCSMAMVLGVQAAYFGIFARLFGSMAGVMPESARLNRLVAFFNLERGLFAGVGLMIAGVVFLLTALLAWRDADYGGISYSASLRLMIPAVTLITIGFEVCFSSFFLSVIFLAAKRQRSACS